jgi:hypothetical protein
MGWSIWIQIAAVATVHVRCFVMSTSGLTVSPNADVYCIDVKTNRYYPYFSLPYQLLKITVNNDLCVIFSLWSHLFLSANENFCPENVSIMPLKQYNRSVTDQAIKFSTYFLRYMKLCSVAYCGENRNFQERQETLFPEWTAYYKLFCAVFLRNTPNLFPPNVPTWEQSYESV